MPLTLLWLSLLSAIVELCFFRPSLFLLFVFIKLFQLASILAFFRYMSCSVRFREFRREPFISYCELCYARYPSKFSISIYLQYKINKCNFWCRQSHSGCIPARAYSLLYLKYSHCLEIIQCVCKQLRVLIRR